MSQRIALSILSVALAFGFNTTLRAEAVVKPETSAAAPTVIATNLLKPSPDDSLIAYVTAAALEANHFRRHRLDDEYSEKFFDRYVEALDPQRLHLTQEDLASFASYRTNLDNLTVGRREKADTRPAYEIFNRMRQRVNERVAYANELLKSEKFEFNTEESIIINRKDEPAPRDLDEARHLWRQRLRSEYLGEKVAKYAAKKKRERDEAETAEKPAKKQSVISDETKKVEKDTPKKTEAEEIVETLSRRYNRIGHFYGEFDQDDVLEVYLTALAHVYDPHTDYFNPRQAEDFSIGMNLSLFGIGAVLTSDQDGYCKISDLKPGPAFKSKQIKIGDRIVAVSQSNAPPVDVIEMKLSKIVQMVRGPRGTQVTLTIVSAESTTDRRDVTLIRDEIKLDDQAAKGKVIDIPGAYGKTNRIGVIDLPSFYIPMDLNGPRKMSGEKTDPHYTSTDVAKLLAKFKKENVEGIILDLRRNGGGSLEECVKMTGLFIKDGPVVQVRDAFNRVYVDEDRDARVQYDGPLIVLTSRYSASASEILAGALQDYDRALIVGDLSTHGKGTVQQLQPLRQWITEDAMTNDPGTLKITKAKFYRASGASTQLKGVLSDIVLPSRENHAKEIGESSIESSLPYDKIEATRYDKENDVMPFKTELLARSSARVAKDRDYDYVRQDIEIFRKHQAMNSLSLNEQQRLQEWDEEDLRQRARKKERLARKPSDRVIYEVTLAQADQPGLSSASKTNAADTKVEGVAGVDKTSSEDADAIEEVVPSIDPALDETQRILLDYIGLIGSKGVAATTPGIQPNANQP